MSAPASTAAYLFLTGLFRGGLGARASPPKAVLQVLLIEEARGPDQVLQVLSLAGQADLDLLLRPPLARGDHAELDQLQEGAEGADHRLAPGDDLVDGPPLLVGEDATDDHGGDDQRCHESNHASTPEDRSGSTDFVNPRTSVVPKASVPRIGPPVYHGDFGNRTSGVNENQPDSGRPRHRTGAG